MTDEQIIEMAKESGIPIANIPNLAFGRLESGVELLKTFAKLVAQHEQGEPVGEVVVESMGVLGSDAMQVRLHFYKEIPPVGSKIYTAPQPKQQPAELEITIDDDDALAYLRDMVVQSDGDLTPIRLVVWGGHSGYGLYIASADYPEEGAIKIADVAATPPAAHQLWVGLTYEDMIEVWNKLYKERTDVMPLPTTFAKAIEAKLKQKNGYAEEKNT